MMGNGKFDEEFTKDEEIVLFLNLETGKHKVYKGSQLEKKTSDKEYEAIEFTLRQPFIE